MADIRVAIADDHKIFRKGVILSLRHYTNLKFVLEADNGEELLANIAQAQPDVVLMDLRMKIGQTQHFDVPKFLRSLGWRPEQASPRWQGKYRSPSATQCIIIHSQSGQGDVTATLASGEPLVVEAKKGTIANCKSSSEYPLLREALGQLLTLEAVPENAVLAVAVPHGERFIKLAARWREAPLVKRSGIRLLTVAQTGEVAGW